MNAVLDGISIADVTLTAAVTNAGNNECTSLSARYSGPADSNMYIGGVCIIAGAASAHIWRNVGGTWTLLGTAPLGTATGKLQFSLFGSSLVVSFNGKPVLAVVDTAISAPGTVGMRSVRAGGSYQSFSAVAFVPPPTAPFPYSDGFSRADSAVLGGSWIAEAGNIDISSDSAVSGSATAADAMLNGISVADVTLTATVKNTGNNECTSLSARYSGPGDSNMYIGGVCIIAGSPAAHIWRNVGGTWALLGTAPLSTATGTLQFSVFGSLLVVSFNGAPVISVTDTAITAPGTVGLRTFGIGGSYQSFSAAAYVPPPLATIPYSDAFSGADSAVLGGSWVAKIGNIGISGNAAVSASTTAADAVLYGISIADVTLTAAVQNTGNNECTSLSARYSGPGDSNMYIGGVCIVSGAPSAHIYRNVGGTWALLASKPISTASGTLQFTVRGSSLAVSFNGASVLSVTDTAITAPGTVGIRTFAVGGSLHSFSAAAP
jgi:hypothetical protein